MRFTAKIVTTTAVAALTVGGLAGAAEAQAPTPVQRAESAQKDRCKKGWVCLYSGKHFKGRMLRFNASGHWINLVAYGFGKKTSSWKNRTSDTGYLKGPGGPGLKLRPGASDGDMGRFDNWATKAYI
ncbi:peptidase inhibitor family I36 protein [Streptomyces sp. NPDC052114]|uniref:peptidase inhibitor family I36 protein n=1 Tax=unclassified Streptomyces TaxID=2593676 RepID=UPI0034277EF1